MMFRSPLGVIPIDELHTASICAYCGRRGRLGYSLKRTVHVGTHAVAHVCNDVVACERRREIAKRPI